MWASVLDNYSVFLIKWWNWQKKAEICKYGGAKLRKTQQGITAFTWYRIKEKTFVLKERANKCIILNSNEHKGFHTWKFIKVFSIFMNWFNRYYILYSTNYAFILSWLIAYKPLHEVIYSLKIALVFAYYAANMEAGHRRAPNKLEGRNLLPVRLQHNAWIVGKYPRNESTVLCCRQEGRGSWGDRTEWQQPDQLDISTSEAPSHLQLCCSHHRLLQSTLCEQRSCTDNVHILQLLNLVLSLSILGLNKSLA